MPDRPNKRQLVGRIALIVVPFVLTLLIWLWPTTPTSHAVQVAAAKGQYLSTQGIRLTAGEALARAVAEADGSLGDLLAATEFDFLAADAVGQSLLRRPALADCQQGACVHATYYDYGAGGTIEAVIDLGSERVLDIWRDPTARPRATAHIVAKAMNIAAVDSRVEAKLGNLRDARFVMSPMSIWLVDDACRDDWCVDLTFPSPAGDGRILHVTVNMQQERVARLFYTRGRDDRPLLQSEELDPNAPRYTNGCFEGFDWSVCWEMTAHDGIDFIDATYQDQLIFSSVKIAQVEVYYPAWPGGYRDEVGFNASVLPKFDTRVSEFDDGFEVRQLFTEEFQWPNCVCCYRYEQVLQFYSDGSINTLFISHGPGCDDLSIYRPFWRFDVDLDAADKTNTFTWEAAGWTEVETEADLQLYGATSPAGERLATFADDGLHYRWIPELTDPLGLDEGRLFLLRHGEGEGDGPIEAGPADTFEPPRQWLDDEPLSGNNVVVWYIPFLKTKNAAPWYCQPEPAPDVSPCTAIFRLVPGHPLDDPEEMAAATAEAAITPSPVPTSAAGADGSATATPAATKTPAPIPGVDAVTIIQNAGCGACHLIGPLGEEGKVGPELTFVGEVAGERIEGLTAAAYIRQSLLTPDAFIAPACPNGECVENAMPAYAGRLTDGQIETLITFLLEELPELEAAASVAGTPRPTSAADSTVADTDGLTNSVVTTGLVLLVLLVGIALIIYRRTRGADAAEFEEGEE